LINLAVDPNESLALNDRNREIDSSPVVAIAANSSDIQLQIEPSSAASSVMPLITENSVIKAELESLLMSLQLTIPQPNSEFTCVASAIDENSTLTEIAENTQPLFQALNITHDRITSIYAHLQVTHQQNQTQVESIDNSILEVKQLKFRTQQLARHSKNQLEKAGTMLESIEQMHTELTTGLAKFGGHAEIQAMLVQLETTRHSLLIAHDRATTGQEAFYDSLRAIQVDTAACSDESAQKLARYHESLQRLSETVAVDRLQLATMNADVTNKLTNLASLSNQITTTNTQALAAVETIRARMVEIDREFAQISASIQTETEQFYELTVTAIEKTEAIGWQLANIVKQMSEDRDSISKLTTETASMRHIIRQETEQKLHNLDLRYHQLMTTWDDFQVRQKERIVTAKKFSRWLWILSFAVGGILVMLVRILMMLT
jgi:hypothetical protein